MKFRTLRKWDNPEQLEGLVFFAQLLEELLFNYSLDTYKPSAMNTCTLCLEALSLIGDIEKEMIDKNNLNHVLEELSLNLKKDVVAHALLDIDIESIRRKLNNLDTPALEKKILIEIVYSQIELNIYKNKTEKILLEAVGNGKQKNRIRALTRSYVTTLISIGYSTRYLYPTTRMFFHWGGNRIKSPGDLERFFELLASDTQKYCAIFKANRFFEIIKDSCKDLDIAISRKLEGDNLNYVNGKNYLLNSDETYLTVENIEVKDVFSARDEAERRIEEISTLSTLFHHKEIPTWNPSALLINIGTKTSRLVSSSQNPMLMCSDMRTETAAIKLNSFIREFSLKESYSFKKFARAAELHALALRSDSSENQLLNLWVGLETLTPCHRRSETVGIWPV